MRLSGHFQVHARQLNWNVEKLIKWLQSSKLNTITKHGLLSVASMVKQPSIRLQGASTSQGNYPSSKITSADIILDKTSV